MSAACDARASNSADKSSVDVRQATDADVATLIELRAAWTGQSADPAYVAAFEQWWRRERDQRVTWLAETAERAVGMLNMLIFSRMPRPDRPRSAWGYVANVFVLEEHRDGGIGRRLIDAATAYADDHDFARIVLSPSPRSVPFYQRAGFGPAKSLMLRTPD